jgi:hypothetical protein
MLAMFSCTISLYCQDSIKTYLVADGIIHRTYYLPDTNIVNVLEVDLKDTTIAFEVFGLDSLATTSEQVKLNRKNGKNVVAAVNSDFFSITPPYPVGIMVKDGNLITSSSFGRSHFCIDSKNRPNIGNTITKITVTTSGCNILKIDNINVPVDSISNINIYSSAKTYMPSDSLFLKIGLRFIGDGIDANGETKGIVDKRGTRPYILCIRKQFHPGLRFDEGDTVIISTKLVGERIEISPKEVLGGLGRILLNGRVLTIENTSVEKGSPDFFTRRHPRTFIGFNKDTTKLFICVVDGRQSKSVGMNFEEMGRFLLSINAWNAMNFDGGGSTTMVVGDSVVNSPSDKKGERRVANSLQIMKIHR